MTIGASLLIGRPNTFKIAKTSFHVEKGKMPENTKKATYINLYLLAAADGRIDPREKEYLLRYAKAAGISEEEQREWQEEFADGQVHFRSIEDRQAANQAIALLARMVRVDGEFDPDEQETFIAMGKALGFSPDELGPVLRTYWDRDPLDPIDPSDAELPRGGTSESPITVVKDDLEDLAKVEASAAGIPLRFCGFDELEHLSPVPRVVIFHLAEEKSASKSRLDTLKATYPESFVAFVARRDQAPQIGWLLSLGADRCFVEPLYPQELRNALSKIASS
jgi:tellurite resistance protein